MRKISGRLEYICKFPDPNGHKNHQVGEAATISEPLVTTACICNNSYKYKRLYLLTMLSKKARMLQEEI